MSGNVVSLRARAFDGIANLFSRLGTTADRQTNTVYWTPIIGQQQLEAAYRGSWLTRKVHDLVPFEMTRAGRDWQADKTQITALEKEEKRLRVWAKIADALRVARLHGGSAIILGVRSGMPDQPLAVERLGKNMLRYMIVASRFQLSAPRGMDNDPESDYYGQPAMYALRGAKGNEVLIHPSRVITFHGAPVPSGALACSQLDQFWGDPLLLSIKSAIDNAETSQAAVATLLHEMKQDVISIPGLSEMIGSEELEARLAARIEAINRLKSMFSTLLLDGGDDEGKGGEKWETRQLSFAQHPELLRQFISIVAGAADIPVTRLMGESPGGLQSTGKGEQADFNRMIEAQQEAVLTPALHRLDEILVRSALGSFPDTVSFEYGALAEDDEAAEATTEKTEAETAQILHNLGLIPGDALGKALVNRLIESGRWPGLEKAIDESEGEIGLPPDDNADTPDPNEPTDPAATTAKAAAMAKRGTVTRDQALALIADAAPRTLYVSRKLLNAAEFIAWAKGQGFDTTLASDELHVTIAHSRTPVDWLKAGEAYDWDNPKDGRLTVAPGGARLIEKFDGGAVVLAFVSSSLSYRHEQIKNAGADWGYFEYQPHVTITYAAPEGLDLSKVEPYRGKLEFGPEIFAEVDENWSENVNEE